MKKEISFEKRKTDRKIGLILMFIALFCFLCGSIAYIYINESEIETVDFISSEEIKNDYKISCETYDYKNLCRTPNEYVGKRAKFTGQVLQVMENQIFSKDTVSLRIGITESSYGIWDDPIYVTYTRKSEDEPRILENDIITIYGELDGLQSYTALFGNQISIPKINAMYYDLIE